MLKKMGDIIMFDKNHFTGNRHLSAEPADAFEVRMVREKPELAEGIRRLQELLEPEVYKKGHLATFRPSTSGERPS